MKLQVKNKLHINIDVLKIDLNKSKVELLADKVNAYYEESSSLSAGTSFQYRSVLSCRTEKPQRTVSCTA